RKRLERCTTPLAIAGCVDDDLLALLAATVRDRIEQILDRVDRLPMPADQETGIGGGARRNERLVVLAHIHPRLDAERSSDARYQLAHVGRRLAFVDRGRRDRV